jgi:hypothetical protein
VAPSADTSPGTLGRICPGGQATGNLFPWDLIIFEFVIKLIIGIDY